MDTLVAEVTFPSQRNGWADPGELHLSVNGKPLRSILPRGADLAGLTPRELPPSRHLLGEPASELGLDGRAAVLVCPLCGDIGCGAVLARITLTPTRVTWRDLVFGNTYAPDDDEPIGAQFDFDRAAYERALHTAARAPARRQRDA